MLLPTAYLPPISWCSAFWNARTVVIEAAENYQKGSLRNRAYIAGPNGVQRLSIPLVKGKHQQTPIREVRIAYEEDWQRQHWRTIRTAYGNAPYFEHYSDELKLFYEERYAFLFDFNLELMRFILVKKMGWKPDNPTPKFLEGGSVEFRSSDSGTSVNPTPSPSPFGEGGSIELRSENSGTSVFGDNVIFGQGDQDILAKEDVAPLSEWGGLGGGVSQDALAKWVALTCPDENWSGIHYPQVFEDKHGFLSNLSILDLLFCCGKRGGEILEKSIIQT